MRNALFIRVGGQNLGTADDLFKEKLELAGFIVTKATARTSDFKIKQWIERSEVIFITGHNYVGDSGEKFDFRLNENNIDDPNTTVRLSEMARSKSEPLSLKTKVIIITGCNSCTLGGPDFVSKEFPMATLIGWASPSPKNFQWMLWESFVKNLKIEHSENDTGFIFRAAFGDTLDDLAKNKSKSNVKIRLSNGEWITEKLIFKNLFDNEKLGLYVPNSIDGGVLFKYKWNKETSLFDVIHTRSI